MKCLDLHTSSLPANRRQYRRLWAILELVLDHLLILYRVLCRNSIFFLATTIGPVSGKGNGGCRMPRYYLRQVGAVREHLVWLRGEYLIQLMSHSITGAYS